MATGLAGGLAEGLQGGLALGSQLKQQQFEQGLQSRYAEMAQQEQGIRVDEETRAKARDALGAIQQQKEELSSQMGPATARGDTSNMRSFDQQRTQLHDAEQHAFRILGGPELHEAVTSAQDNADALHFGRKTVADLSPKEFDDVVTLSTQRPAADFIDTPNHPSPVGQQLKAFHQGVANLPKDNGASLLKATNDLYSHELGELINRQADDGSIITGAEFAPPMPHPDSPGHMLVGIHLTTRKSDGNGGYVQGDQVIPFMDDHGQILAHPDDKQNAPVKNFHLNDLFNHVGALETTYKALNADPDARGHLLQSVIDGNYDAQARMLDWLHVLGHNPSDYLPTKKVELGRDGTVLVSDQHGNYTVDRAPPKPLQGTAAVDQELLDAVNSGDPARIAKAKTLAALVHGESGLRNPDLTTVMPVVINGPGGQSIIPFQTHGPHPGVSADGMTPPMRADGTAPQPGDASDTGGVQIPPLPGATVPPLPRVGAGGGLQLPPGTTASRLGGGGGMAGVGDPKSVENTAQMIANGQIPALSGFALRTPWGQAVISRVREIKPDYQAADQPAIAKAERDFATGKEGNAVRSFNVAISHMDTLGKLADALDNGDTQLINSASNLVSKQLGSPKVTNFNSAKQIVADEVVKAITAGGGALADREEAARQISAASSPAQLKGVIQTWQSLMRGQLDGLRQQYETTTGKKDFDKFLSANTRSKTGDRPTTNSKGWALHQDKDGNYAYVSPDGKQFEEAK